MSTGAYRVAHIPTSVGGNPQRLSQQLRELGVESEAWVFEQNVYNYPSTYTVWKKTDGPILREMKRLLAIVRVAFGFDVIHFNFGTGWATSTPLLRSSDRSLKRRVRTLFAGLYLNGLSILELELYRLLRRPMFVHYQGDDARQGDVSLSTFSHSIAHYVGAGYYSPETDRLKRRVIKRMAKYCQKLYAVNPDLMHVLGDKARFIPYCHISLGDWHPIGVEVSDHPLRIGHAPTHRQAKGTDFILAALEDLRAEGYRFDLVLIEGLSSQAARLEYEKIDVMIDQLHAGWYGGLAVELMALGKPVMAYIREEDLKFIPVEMKDDLPLLRITKDTLKQDLRRVFAMSREELAQLGMRSRRYVEKWHDPLRITEEIKRDYDRALGRMG